MITTVCIVHQMSISSDHHDDGLPERQVGHLRDAGRLSAREAELLLGGDDEKRGEVLAEVRARHMAERLADALRLGLISDVEAGDLTERASDSEQARQVRREVNRLARQANAMTGGSS